MDAKEEVDGERIVAFADKHIREKIANERIVTTWDLAGQSQYFSTHRLFLSQRALYVVVVNLHPEEQKFYDVKAMAKDEDPLAFLKRRCEYWRDYLHLKAPGQRYIVVFTHADEVDLSPDDIRSRVSLCAGILSGARGFIVVGLQNPESPSCALEGHRGVLVGMDSVRSSIRVQFDHITSDESSKHPLG
jgi:hypothetical protein